MARKFEDLIAPLSQQEFFRHYWGKEFFVSRGSSNRFAGLFSWDALSEILSTQRFEFPRLRLLSGGRVAPPSQYILQKTDRRGNEYFVQDAAVIERMMADGAMLHITSIGEAWKPLDLFAASLEPILGGKVQVNLHAGYPTARGFHTHWDGHDVYAVQIDGRKMWRLFGFTEEAPLAVPPEEKQGAPENHTWEGDIGTGQVLYLPRGYWHATQYTSDASLHLTFAVQHPTGVEFFQWLARQLSNRACMRRDIPISMFDMPDIGDLATANYIADVRETMLRAISNEALEKYVGQYRATLGKVNHLQLLPAERISHACK